MGPNISYALKTYLCADENGAYDRFPELDEIAVRALANRWHFGWSR